MQLFYTPDITGNQYTLSEEESKHCTRVLRLKAGDELYLTNGKGTLYKCVIEDAHEKRCLVFVQEKHEQYGAKPYYLHIAIAPTKNTDRLEWFLEKCTEIGVDEITPLICERSERRDLKTDRLQKVLVAAMKQSLKAWLPKLNEPVKLNDFVKTPVNAVKVIAHCNETPRTTIAAAYNKGDNMLALIGPEGDFSEREVQLAQQQGFTPVSIGDSRLRTETAGIVVCSVAYIKNMP